ncbi:MAG: hypothetical protein K6F94_07240 [Bacteroidaceae bacterium]|nr:hypothetical protein [Bacteroidaceae bacterium]
MKYEYAYKTPDGIRHVEEMEAPSREAVFGILREKGIKAIKVYAKDGSKANGEVRVIGVRRRVTVALVLIAAIVAGVVGSWFSGGADKAEDSQLLSEPESTVEMIVATPLPRQAIQGDRSRVENAPTNLFNTALERYLSRFAEPGRKYEDIGVCISSYTNDVEIMRVLESPISYAKDEFTEYIDLKRITAGIKREMRAYIRGGHTAQEYFSELEKRQMTEMSYREKAETRLRELMGNADSAYVFWLKANAQLQAMGIFPLPLPDELMKYQSDFDLND